MHHCILIECTDQPGLVYGITGVLFGHGLNITANAEFVDHELGLFFMRTEVAGPVDPAVLKDELAVCLPTGAAVRIFDHRKKDIVVLASHEPHCLGDLLLRHAYGELNANIKAIVSNHEDLRSLAEGFNLRFEHVPVGSLSRAEHEQRLIGLIESLAPEYLVLAKYMRVLTPGFVGRFRHRIVNIHHSFLPAFVGANPYRQAFERGVKIIGATAHFVTDDLDEGPIITQDVLPVNHAYDAEAMRQAGRDVEKVVLARALKLVFEDRVFISGNKTIVFE